MARPLFQGQTEFFAGQPAGPAVPGQAGGSVVFRALVDLATGDVAGIEASHGETPGEHTPFWPRPFGGHGLMVPWTDSLDLRGRAADEPDTYLVRANLGLRADHVAGRLGVATDRTILMYDVGELLTAPFAALEALLAAKRAGARILLDHFDLEQPPVRLLEMLPADILRVFPDRMPWHWGESRRLETMESLTAFAANLLMDVAVADVAGGHCQALRRLGVRYAQGRWRRDPQDRLRPSNPLGTRVP